MDERYEEVRARFAEEVQAGRVTFHRNFSNEIADEFEDSYFDWVYVDGNHHYEFVRQDLKLYYPKVKPEGLIAGDDYGSRGWWDNGVQKAVDEFVSQRPDLTLEVHGTQFVIQKPERASPADEPVKADLALREIAQRTGKMPEGRLPDFLLIGAQKCGTGFLFRLLSQHPRVEPAVIKEVGFFSNHFEKGLEWYRSCFPAPAHEDGRPVWTWEASPNDLFYPHAPRRAAEIVPRAKLIALLRNPVDRAYSHFHHQVRMGHEPLSSFEAALEAEEKRLRGKRERMLQDERYSSVNFPRFSYVSRGLYADQLREWYEYFGRDQLLVIKSEDLFERPREILAQIVGFLGLPEWEPGTVTPPRTKYHNEPMSLATRQRLEEYFEPHNRRLYELLGRDFGW